MGFPYLWASLAPCRCFSAGHVREFPYLRVSLAPCQCLRCWRQELAWLWDWTPQNSYCSRSVKTYTSQVKFVLSYSKTISLYVQM